MELLITKYKSFENYIREVLNHTNITEGCNIVWEEHKARYVYKGSGKITPEIFQGQIIDISGVVFNKHVFIEVKETKKDKITVNGYLTKKQKQYLTKVSSKPGCYSIILLYFHKSQKIYLLTYPLVQKTICFDEKENTELGIFLCERRSLMFDNFLNEIGRTLWKN